MLILMTNASTIIASWLSGLLACKWSSIIVYTDVKGCVGGLDYCDTMYYSEVLKALPIIYQIIGWINTVITYFYW
jgi:hypothetical protein